MPYSSTLIAIAGASICVAAIAIVMWWQYRRRLNQVLEEWKALKKSSNLLEIERLIVDRMNGGASLKEILDILTRAIEDMTPDCLCSVMLLDDERQHLWEGSKGGLSEEYMRAIDGLAIGPEVGACGSAAFRNQTIVVEDIATDPRFATVKDFVMSFGLLACWSVPIRGSNQEALGTFAMYHRHRAKPKERELRIVEAAAQLAGNAVERLRATARLKENEERIVLAEKAAFLGIWELDIAHDILTLSQELAAQVGLPDAAHQLTIGQLRAMVHPDDWQAVLEGLDQASQNGKMFNAEFRIVLDNGLIRWFRTQARVEFADHKPKRMMGVSVDITKEKDLVDKLHYLAAHDDLTGVWNRRAIFELMKREFEIAARLGTTTGVMMLDLDHFKKVNDTYGHPAGDSVLKESVRRLEQTLRSYDLVGRYGGEEFLVVFPRCDEDQVRECAERVRIAIAEEPIVADGVSIQITVSVGTTVLNSSINSEQEALATADTALYDAKAFGRNRAVHRSPNSDRRGPQPGYTNYSV
jgi:diguanylate cyclase (GGDEF)-like protein